MRTEVKPIAGMFSPDFMVRNVLAGMAAFVAPIVAAGAAMAAVSRPDVDVMKVVARMRHPERLSMSAREAMLVDSDKRGRTLKEALDSLQLSNVERAAIRHMIEREKKTAA